MNQKLLTQINGYLLNNLYSNNIPNGAEQRTVGDLLSFKIKEYLLQYSNPNIVELQLSKSKKSMENFVLIDTDGISNYFNIVTHDINSKFSMPNLTSINRIKDVFNRDNENLLFMFVSYEKNGSNITVIDIDIKYIWQIDFNNLRIGSLGKGQLQISNMNKDITLFTLGKTIWFNYFKQLVIKYHQNRIMQINKDALQWV